MLRFLYFTIACTALAWGLCGWASHFLMPAPTSYKISLVVGVIGGLIVTLYPWGRNLTRVFLLAIWPIIVVTTFFSLTGTFNFSDVSFAELLNLEFSLLWLGAIWATIVLRRRKTISFNNAHPTTKGWQKAHSHVISHPTYRIPTRESVELNSEKNTTSISAVKDEIICLDDELTIELSENEVDYTKAKPDKIDASLTVKSENSNDYASGTYKQNGFIFDTFDSSDAVEE